MGYDINHLPPYPVGLFGALSIVEGSGARCKLGLTFDETQSLEAGFNGCLPDMKNKKKKKRQAFKLNPELMKIGAELTLLLYKQPKPRGMPSWGNTYFDEPQYVGSFPAATASTSSTFTVSYSGTFGNPASPGELLAGEKKKRVAEKKAKLEKMMEGVQVKAAQVAPNAWEDAQELAEIKKQILAELPNDPQMIEKIIEKAGEILKPKSKLQNGWAEVDAFDNLAHPNDLQIDQNGDVMLIPANAPAWEIHPLEPVNLPANLQDEQMPSFDEEE